MTPEVGSKRTYKNDASWFGFWLSDAETDALVSATFAAYDASVKWIEQRRH